MVGRMLPCFDSADVVAHDECHVIYRRGTVMGLELFGVIDDDRSERWRQGFEHEVIRGGYPDYYAIDGQRMEAVNGAGSRLRSALFVRGLMRRAKYAVVFGSTKTSSSIVMSALLRVAGISNALLVTNMQDFTRAVEKMHMGLHPTS